MKCERAQELLIDLVYDELSDEERSAIDSHLAECDSCRNESARLRMTVSLLGDAAARDDGPAVELSPVELAQKLTQHTERSRWRWRFAAGVAASAALLLLIAGSLSLRLEVHNTHVVVSWGADRTRAEPGTHYEHVSTALNTQLAAHASRLDELDELIDFLFQAEAANARERDLDRIALTRRLSSMQEQSDTRWRTVARYLRRMSTSPDLDRNIQNTAFEGE